MSAPFPTPVDPFAKQRVIIIKERDVHVPTWYVPHEDPDTITVMEDGLPLIPTIKVGMIAPERRWAVRPSGNLLSQNEFKELYKRKYVEWFAVCESKPLKVSGKPENIWIPHVTEYVKWKVDPRNAKSPTLVPIHEPEDTTGAKPKNFHDGEGEKLPGARLDHLAACYRDPKLRGVLTPAETAEVEAYLGTQGVPVTTGVDLASQLEVLNDLLAAGDITPEVHSRRVALLTGTVVPEEVQETPSEGVQAPCGKMLHPRSARHHEQSVRMHRRRCSDPACKAGD
jgi:hypothetical protein